MKLTVKGKNYSCGKITRKKYSKFNKIYEELEQKDGKQSLYTDQDLDNMVEFVVEAYDNNFTIENINEEFDVPEIIFAFSSIMLEIQEKLNKKVEKVQTNFTKK